LKKATSPKKAKILKIVVAVIIAAAVFFAGFFVRYLTLDKSVKSIMWIKSMVDSKYYTDISDEEFLSAVTGGLDSVLDDYSTYYTPDEYQDYKKSYAGSNTGLGLSFTLTYGVPRIFRVSGNSPAERAGIPEGGFVVGFGDSEENITYSSDYSEMSAYISGKGAYEDITLAVSSDVGGENAVLYTLQKEDYSENYVFYRSKTSAYRFSGSDALTLTEYDGAISGLDEDTAYIRLNRFAGNAVGQLQIALNVFKEEGKKNLVLDLRGNGGGDLDVLRGISAFFCKNAEGSSPIIATAHYKDGSTVSYKATGVYYNYYFSSDSKITVLANKGTASASECLLGAMLEYGTIDYDDIILSDILGAAKTYGKGIMQTTYYNVFGGDAIKLTVATIHWPITDKCIHGEGITVADGARSVYTTDYTTFGDEELANIVENYLK